jgi:hypothetical protein
MPKIVLSILIALIFELKITEEGYFSYLTFLDVVIRTQHAAHML